MFEDEKAQKVNIKLVKSDIKELFQKPPESKAKKIALGVLKWTSLIILIFIFGFVLVNAPSIFANGKYFVYVNLLNKNYPSKISAVTVSADNPQLEKNNHLIIPKIGVDAAVQYNIDQSQLRDKLKNGLVHLKESSLPGEMGNVFIVGHSSYYWWINNANASVFALLNNLKVGDKILLTYNNNSYVYQVTNVLTLKSGEIEVEKSPSKKQLTLMTYSPIGTYLNKLLVISEQIGTSQTSAPSSQTQAEITPRPTPSPQITASPQATPQASPLPAETDLKFLPEL